jgi:hypothetical protein
MEIVRLTFAGRICHAEELEVMPLPSTTRGMEPRVAFIVELPDGFTLMAEVELEQLKQVVGQLEPWEKPEPH